MSNKMRDEFEAWALERFINSETMRPLERDPEEPKEYRYGMVNMAWLAWQESRESLVVHIDLEDWPTSIALEIQQAIEAAGVKVKP